MAFANSRVGLHAADQSSAIRQGGVNVHTIPEGFKDVDQGLENVLAIGSAAVLSYFAPVSGPVIPNLAAGIERVWHPAVVISLQTLWVIVFMMFGKSMVTGAEISFHLHHDRI